MEKVKAHVAEWKKEEVSNIQNLIKKYRSIGVLDLTNLPSPQLQKIRSQLKDVVITMARLRLIKLALDSSDKKNIKELINHINGIPALIFSNEDCFKLSKKLIKSKIPAAAKAGQIAPTDLIAPAGPTPFTPGPIIGELGQLGIKTMVEGGKISIKENAIIVKSGKPIPEKAATLLAKLGIEPMEIGINMVAAYEDGNIYHGDVLNVNERDYIEKLKMLYKESFNLALNIEYPTKETAEILIKKAWMDAVALSSKLNIETSKEFKKVEEVKTEKKEHAKREEEPKLTDIKTDKVEGRPIDDKQFKEAEEVAKNILNNLQKEKAKNLKIEKPREPRVKKGPSSEELL